MIAAGAPLPDILAEICGAIDAQDPGRMSTILLMDQDGNRLWPAAGPRVPRGWSQAITPLTIGPAMGSCGTAAFREERVIISDIASDPLWSGAPTSQSQGPEPQVTLDLGEVMLVDVGVVRFLVACEESGVELLHCSPYIRQWMARERPGQ